MSKYADNYWRRQAAPDIAQVIAANPEAGDSALRIQLRGARQHFTQTPDATRAWNAEVEAQMATRRGHRERPAVVESGSLFGE